MQQEKNTKIMASGPITSWQIDGEKAMTDFIFLGSKITADSDCSHEIKRHLLLGRIAVTNLDSILQSRDITLPTKVLIVETMFFPVVMYRCGAFPDSSVGKESTCNSEDPGSIARLGRSAGEGISYPLQYSWASLVAQLVKNLPAIKETWV